MRRGVLFHQDNAPTHRVIIASTKSHPKCWFRTSPSSSAFTRSDPVLVDWLSSDIRPHQHSIGHMGDDFYRWGIKVLKEKATKEKLENANKIHIYIQNNTLKGYIYKAQKLP